jgi:hypothetical protein
VRTCSLKGGARQTRDKTYSLNIWLKPTGWGVLCENTLAAVKSMTALRQDLQTKHMGFYADVRG